METVLEFSAMAKNALLSRKWGGVPAVLPSGMASSFRPFAICVLMLTALGGGSAIAHPFDAEITAFAQQDAVSPPKPGGIVFTGSSSIRRWTTLASDFPGLPVVNRGFGGSQIEHAEASVDRLVLVQQPKVVVFYAGGNDLNAGKEPAVVVADLKRFVAAVHAGLPRARIAYVSIAGNPARWAQVDKVKQVNSAVAAMFARDRRLTFVNVFHAMLGPDGKPQPDIFVADKLHMNEKGYAIWAKILLPVVQRLYRAPTGVRHARP